MDDAAYTLTEVQKTYGPRTVLQVPTLRIQQGEILAIVGPSGAGKSTLLRLLALLETPTRGRVCLQMNGRQVTCANASTEERRQLGMVFQRPVLLSRSTWANVAYGLQVQGEKETRRRVNEALKRVSLLPLAYKHSRTLSGGEVQRVALARVLVLEPRILLLDEPTANLDPTNVRLIEGLIQEQHDRANTTIVLVTHNIFQARRLASRVALLLDGEMVEIAPSEDFFNRPHDPRAAAFVSGELAY